MKLRNDKEINALFASATFSHRTHRTHRSFWLRKIFSHGLHGYAQIRRAHQTIFPQNSRNTQKRLAEKKNLCTSVKSVGGSSPPEISVNSVNSVGGLQMVAWVWQECHTLLRKLPQIARMCTD